MLHTEVQCGDLLGYLDAIKLPPFPLEIVNIPGASQNLRRSAWSLLISAPPLVSTTSSILPVSVGVATQRFPSLPAIFHHI